MILGLGITRLLSTVLALFRSRRELKGDWIAFAWALCIFIQQLQYWWAIMELPTLVHSWSLWSFLLLVTLTLLLFAAADLILPPPVPSTMTDLPDAFERNGKWALVALGGYFLLAMIANWVLWGVSPFSLTGADNVAQMILPFIVVRSRTRMVRVAITVAYVPLAISAATFL